MASNLLTKQDVATGLRLSLSAYKTSYATAALANSSIANHNYSGLSQAWQ